MGWLINIVGSALSMVGSWFKGKRALQKAKLKTRLAIEEQKVRLASQTEKDVTSWGIESLYENYKWTRAIILILLFIPVLVTAFSPVDGTRIFKALNVVPHWYWTLLVIVVLADFGVRVGLGAIAGAIRSIFKR